MLEAENAIDRELSIVCIRIICFVKDEDTYTVV